MFDVDGVTSGSGNMGGICGAMGSSGTCAGIESRVDDVGGGPGGRDSPPPSSGGWVVIDLDSFR